MKAAPEIRIEALRFAEAELADRIQWFIRLRWLAAVGVVVGTAVGRWFVLAPIEPANLLAVALGIVAYNLLFMAWDQRLRAKAQTATGWLQAQVFANVQIAADLVTLGVLLHFSGGVENPLCLFFAFHMIIAGILLSPEMAYAQATLATLVFAGVVGLEQTGLVHHVHLGLFFAPDFYRADAAWLIVLTLGVTLLLIVYMTTSITGRLREREIEAAELTRQVAEKAAALEQAYDDMLETQKLQTTYMRKTSHELRAPLSAIASTLDVIADGVVGELQPKQEEMLDRARTRVRGLMLLVDDLLTLLRSRAAPPKERFEAVDLGHVVRTVADVLRDRADQGHVALSVDVPAGLPPVWGDDELLDQLATNLVSNAIKYTPAGGEVSVLVVDAGGSVRLRVTDTGIGIAEQDLPRIFDEFYRTKGGREFTTRGTGLGLSIVKSIADAHGAAVGVESRLGTGTTFVVSFPRGDGAVGPAASPTPPGV
jgi:signal transduction histidine kinase